MPDFSWKKFYSKRTDGGHRSQSEKFLKKEAKEKLLHLDGGKSLLDFGCGSADVLIYIVPEYEKVTGVDFSQSMLQTAIEKCQSFGYNNADFIYADENSIWENITQSYDRIITIGVVQHLTIDQIEQFIKNASERLNPDGKIIFFDVLDSRLFYLWRAGLFSKKYNYFFAFLLFLKLKLIHLIKGGPDDKIMGYSYNPYVIEKIAQKFGLQMEYVSSTYYEYRYHAIIF